MLRRAILLALVALSSLSPNAVAIWGQGIFGTRVISPLPEFSPAEILSNLGEMSLVTCFAL